MRAQVGAVVLTEVGVAVAVGVGGAILPPEQLQGDVLAAHLPVHGRPVGLAGVGGALAVLAVEARLKLGVAHARGQRPGEARGRKAGQHVPDRRVRDAHGTGDGALRELRLELEPQDLPGLTHGHSPVGHRPLLV